jgi:hypothetical protein
MPHPMIRPATLCRAAALAAAACGFSTLAAA